MGKAPRGYHHAQLERLHFSCAKENAKFSAKARNVPFFSLSHKLVIIIDNFYIALFTNLHKLAALYNEHSLTFATLSENNVSY